MSELADSYTRTTVKEGKITLTDDVYAICEFLEKLTFAINKLKNSWQQ